MLTDQQLVEIANAVGNAFRTMDADARYVRRLDSVEDLGVALLAPRLGTFLRSLDRRVQANFRRTLRHFGKAGPDADTIVASLTAGTLKDEAARDSFQRAYLRIMDNAGKASFKLAGLGGRFDIADPLAAEWARTRSGHWIREVTDSYRENVRGLVGTWIAQGGTYHDLSRELRTGLALTKYQNGILSNWAANRGIQVGSEVYQAEYARRIRRRAALMARTEACEAVSQGTLLGYRQRGITEVRFHANAGACPLCAAMDGDIVPLKTAAGVEVPAHPSPQRVRPPVYEGRRIKPNRARKELETTPISSSLALERRMAGTNESTIVTLSDGRKAIFKPMDGMRAGSMGAEKGASLLDDQLGFGRVPLTTIRKVGGKEGSVQLWVENSRLGTDWATRQPVYLDFSLTPKQVDQVRRIMIEDYIMAQGDRHMGNWVVQKGTGNIFAIDNGISFRASAINPDPRFRLGQAKLVLASRFTEDEIKAVGSLIEVWRDKRTVSVWEGLVGKDHFLAARDRADKLYQHMTRGRTIQETTLPYFRRKVR